MNTGHTCPHAPSHLREEFQQWLDSYEPKRLQEIDIRPVASLLDVLADCGDVLPADYCDQLEIPKGSTYAQAVEDVRQYAKRQKDESEDESDDDGLICEGCGDRPTCVVAKAYIDEFDDAAWSQFRKGWLKICDEDMRQVRILCERCAECLS